jgi:hypothetical protein
LVHNRPDHDADCRNSHGRFLCGHQECVPILKLNMTRRLVIVFIPLLMLSTTFAILPVKATPTGTFDVFAPTAYTCPSVQSTVLYPGNAMKLDGSVAILADSGAWISSQGFLNPSYNNYWAPYSNRSAFPPANATILSVSMLTIVRCQVPRPFMMNLVFTVGSYSFSYYSNWFNAAQTDTAYTFNVTSNLVAYGLQNQWGNFTVFVNTEFNYGKALYVDYVGILGLWTWPGPSVGPGGSGTSGEFVGPDAMGLIGIMGFIGMLGIPAASIWFFRRDGGSKVIAGVTTLVAFTVCFGLFYASINGG